MQGTIFRGQSRASLFDKLQVNRMRWSFHPQSLILGRIAYRLRIDSSVGPMKARVAAGLDGSTTISGFEGVLSLPQILSLAGEEQGIASGWVLPDLSEVRRFSDNRVALSGKVHLAKLVWRQGAGVELGGLEILTDGEGPPWTAELRDDGGPVRVSGDVEIGEGGVYRVSATLSAREDSLPEVDQILSLVSPGDSQGLHSVELQGQF